MGLASSALYDTVPHFHAMPVFFFLFFLEMSLICRFSERRPLRDVAYEFFAVDIDFNRMICSIP